MKFLVVGKGAREHAIAWKLAQNNKIDKIFVIPGNDGITKEEKCETLDIRSIDEILKFAKKEDINLTFVGSEEYLAQGIVDKFNETNLKIIGPNKYSTQLESSKVFAKNFMKKYNVQTADYQSFEELNLAIEYINKTEHPLVIKADGLAAGKGVYISESVEESEEAIKELMKSKQFKEAGKRIVIEKYLEGFEASLFFLLDGKNYQFLTVSKDHKKLLEGDSGPNTGGMGAITPHPEVDENLLKSIEKKIIKPTITGLKKENLFYKGILYIGLMIEENEPYVLEYNVRLGDPETQSILYLLKSDFFQILKDIYEGELNQTKIEFYNGYSVCLVLSSEGYPYSYTTGEKILIGESCTSKIFYAGVEKEKENNYLVTNGGRVLSLVSRAKTIDEARNKVYKDAGKVFFSSKYYRKDI
ncbi:phosphoribosylamine--glycine ligase [Petrotoga sp. 9PW.55.5.1]|uniref:phosphoribosylamine--glycine ligase n=1 Tax=Petrotoga sp. 9PW.55.5.1 TaxID=1308979 RepID=UPI000DC3064D|nr:phosphoribosylamine--glycine ligase [Petrotoga sp. 9PW.55.5.1]RAO98418.1 phosphoribosylamine--glycine ligase [Petrotoga sp. 9PW.55.5.1]